MKEGQPKQEPRSNPRITLDQYRGIAGGLMAVNELVADRFMEVGDVRKEVVIVQMVDDRTTSYDQLGSVRVGKRLRIPRWGEKESDSGLRSDSDAWYIQVNDQAISRKARESKSGKRFDEEFTASFRNEVNGGLRKILAKEKLANSGKFSPSVLFGYPWLGITAWSALNLYNGMEGAASDIGFDLVRMVGYNALFFTMARRGSRTISPEDPFVRNSYLDCISPTVPVDRLARGTVYIQMHGNKMIEIPEKSSN